MRLVDAVWARQVNQLAIDCDCGEAILWPANVSVVRCRSCGRAELWHAVAPVPASGVWTSPQCVNMLLTPERE